MVDGMRGTSHDEGASAKALEQRRCSLQRQSRGGEGRRGSHTGKPEQVWKMWGKGSALDSPVFLKVWPVTASKSP